MKVLSQLLCVQLDSNQIQWGKCLVKSKNRAKMKYRNAVVKHRRADGKEDNHKLRQRRETEIPWEATDWPEEFRRKKPI